MCRATRAVDVDGRKSEWLRLMFLLKVQCLGIL